MSTRDKSLLANAAACMEQQREEIIRLSQKCASLEEENQQFRRHREAVKLASAQVEYGLYPEITDFDDRVAQIMALSPDAFTRIADGVRFVEASGVPKQAMSPLATVPEQNNALGRSNGDPFRSSAVSNALARLNAGPAHY